MENQKIISNIVFEMLGRPKEHLSDTMKQLLEAVGAEKGIKINDRKIHEPKKVENKDENGKEIPGGELFSTFSEAEIECENLFYLLSIMFRYMPSHVEIIYPEKFSLSNADLNSLANEIITRLHNYDSIAKSALMNNQLLAKRLQEIMQKGQKSQSGMPLEISYGKPGENRKKGEETKIKNKKKKK
jgi:hypothetical protein